MFLLLLASCSTPSAKNEPAPSLLVKCSLPRFKEQERKFDDFVKDVARYVGKSEKCNHQLDGLIEFYLIP